MKEYAKFVKIHVSLKEKKMALMKEAEETGVPPTRPLMMEYPQDLVARGIHDQFMLGSDLMMAPVFKKGQTKRNIYMPQGVWRHFFTNELYNFSSSGGWMYEQKAELGTPLVFIKVEENPFFE